MENVLRDGREEERERGGREGGKEREEGERGREGGRERREEGEGRERRERGKRQGEEREREVLTVVVHIRSSLVCSWEYLIVGCHHTLQTTNQQYTTSYSHDRFFN